MFFALLCPLLGPLSLGQAGRQGRQGSVLFLGLIRDELGLSLSPSLRTAADLHHVIRSGLARAAGHHPSKKPANDGNELSLFRAELKTKLATMRVCRCTAPSRVDGSVQQLLLGTRKKRAPSVRLSLWQTLQRLQHPVFRCYKY